jgi:hypothetical protein
MRPSCRAAVSTLSLRAAHSSGAIVFGYGYGDPHTDWVAFTFDASGSLLGGSHGGIYRLAAPGSAASPTNYWVPIMGNIGAFMFDGIAYDNLSNVILGGAQDNGNAHQTTPGGLVWVKASNGDGDGQDVLVDNQNYAASSQSARYQSAQKLGGFARRIYDVSGSQVSSTSINTAVITDKRFFTPLAQNAVDPKRFLLGGSGNLYETLDQFTLITGIAALATGSQSMAYGGYHCRRLHRPLGS